MQATLAIQELLNKPDLEIEELLDEDGLQVEIKTNNQRLLDFVLRSDNFERLIKYTIEEPDIDQNFDQKKSFKYPFVAAEILSSESQVVASTFFKTKRADGESGEDDKNSVDEVITDQEEEPENPDDAALDQLFSFLDFEDKVNPTSAGYFCKVVNSLLGKRSLELFKYIYERKPEILDKMIKKTISKSISEVLAKLLTVENSFFPQPVYIDKRVSVINGVIDVFSKDHDLEEINNAAFIICEIFSKYNSMNGSVGILSKLLDQSSIDKFFEYLRSDSAATVNATTLVLSNIIAYYILQNPAKNQNESTQDDNEDSHSDKDTEQELPETLKFNEDTPVVKSLAENIPHISEFCKSAEIPELRNTFGLTFKPLGSARLKMIELISLALKTNKSLILNKITTSNLLQTIFDLFISFEWNNMLHNQVEKIINTILDGPNKNLKVYLFEDLKLIDLILKLTESPNYTFSGKEDRTIRKGYIGHLIKLSNKLNESTEDYIKAQIENNDAWKAYVERFLNPCNQTNKTNLGGKDPRAKEEEEEEGHDAPTMDLPNLMQKFTQYFKDHKKSDQNNEDDDEDDKHDDDDGENAESDDRYNESNQKHTMSIKFSSHTVAAEDNQQPENEIEEDEDQTWFADPSNTQPTAKNTAETTDAVETSPNTTVETSANTAASTESKNEEDNTKKEFNSANYWNEPTNWVSKQDVLKECGLDLE